MLLTYLKKYIYCTVFFYSIMNFIKAKHCDAWLF